MNVDEIILIIVSGLGVIHGLFLAVYLWTFQKGNILSNKLLSLLLIFLSIRVGKSVLLEFTENLDAKIIFTGLSILMIIGPVFYFFTRSAISRGFKLRLVNLLHLVPAIFGIFFGLWITETATETLPLALFASLFLFYYFHLLVYLIISYRYIVHQKNEGLNREVFKFLRMLCIGLLVIWAAYVLNLFDEFIPYITGPILYSIVAYSLSFIIFQRGYVQKLDQAKYKTTPISAEQRDLIYQRALVLIVDEKQYKNPEISLKSLSKSLKVSTQVLSLVINQKSNNNFNTLINTYRINESMQLLKQKEYANLTIASIAYEVGFNSISSFNTAFKKQTGLTPQKYKTE